MSDRRNQARRRTSDYFLVYDSETNELVGRVIDLTIDGARMISETPVTVPRVVQCKLVMPRMIGRHRDLYIEAECKWCKKNHRLGWHESGYEFVNISEENHRIISELIGDWESMPQYAHMPAPSSK